MRSDNFNRELIVFLWWSSIFFFAVSNETPIYSAEQIQSILLDIEITFHYLCEKKKSLCGDSNEHTTDCKNTTYLHLSSYRWTTHLVTQLDKSSLFTHKSQGHNVVLLRWIVSLKWVLCKIIVVKQHQGTRRKKSVAVGAHRRRCLFTPLTPSFSTVISDLRANGAQQASCHRVSVKKV